MKSNSILILLAAAVALVLLAYTYSQKQAEPEGLETKLIPELADNLNKVTKLEVLHKSSETLFTLFKDDAVWRVQERAGYEADIGQLREALLKLANATITEEKTSNVAHYDKLGVEDVSMEQAQGMMLKLTLGDQRATPIIFGNTTIGAGQNQYVRRMGERTSWLIDQQIDWNKTPAYWLRKDLISLPIKQVSKVEILSSGEDAVEIVNEDPEQSVILLKDAPAEDGQVDQSKVYEVADALAKFELLDVVPEELVKDALENAVRLKYASFNGQIIDLRLVQNDQRYFAQIDVIFDAELFDSALLEKMDIAISEEEMRGNRRFPSEAS